MTSAINPSVTTGSNALALSQPDPNNQPNTTEPTPASSYYDNFATTRSNASNDAFYNISGSDINPAANRNNLQLAQNAPAQLPKPIIDKGQNGSGFNRIQVANPNNDPKLTQLNDRLNKIYQESYVRPLQDAVRDFKNATGTAGAATAGAAVGKGKIPNIFETGAAIIANLSTAFFAGNTLSAKVTNATNDYLQKANAELKAAGYQTVDRF